MSAAKLTAFYDKEVEDAKAKDVMLSFHLFGFCVKAFFNDVFEKHAAAFEKLGVDANFGLADLFKKLGTLPDAEKSAMDADIKKQCKGKSDAGDSTKGKADCDNYDNGKGNVG